MPSPPPTSKNLISISSALSSLKSSLTIFAASIIGLSEVSCEPMWKCMPVGSRNSEALAWIYIFLAVCASTPNLFSFSPVEIYGCVFASTPGFTLMLILAFKFSPFAISSSLKSSAKLSTFISKISFSKASFSSSSLLPTPLKMI